MNKQAPMPRAALQSVGSGLLLMTLFTMMWASIAQGNLKGKDHYLVLIFFSVICLVFVFFSSYTFMEAKKIPQFTTAEDDAEGKKMSKRFGIIFALEGITIPIVCVFLGAFGYQQYTIAAIALIVGLHFYPLAKVFGRTIDYYLATWTCICAFTGIYFIYTNTYPLPVVLSFLGIGVAITTSIYGFNMIIEGRRILKNNIQ